MIIKNYYIIEMLNESYKKMILLEKNDEESNFNKNQIPDIIDRDNPNISDEILLQLQELKLEFFDEINDEPEYKEKFKDIIKELTEVLKKMKGLKKFEIINNSGRLSDLDISFITNITENLSSLRIEGIDLSQIEPYIFSNFDYLDSVIFERTNITNFNIISEINKETEITLLSNKIEEKCDPQEVINEILKRNGRINFSRYSIYTILAHTIFSQEDILDLVATTVNFPVGKDRLIMESIGKLSDKIKLILGNKGEFQHEITNFSYLNEELHIYDLENLNIEVLNKVFALYPEIEKISVVVDSSVDIQGKGDDTFVNGVITRKKVISRDNVPEILSNMPCLLKVNEDINFGYKKTYEFLLMNPKINDIEVNHYNDSMSGEGRKYQYSREEFIEINKRIQEIISQVEIPDINDKDREKKIFVQVYDILGQDIKYDNEAVIEEDRKKGFVCIKARNIYGGLVDGLSVCEGYSRILKTVLNELGVKSEYYRAKNKKKDDEDGHAWNIVYLDGKKYFCDLTWDAPYIKIGDYPLKYCLANKEQFGHEEFIMEDIELDSLSPLELKELYSQYNIFYECEYILKTYNFEEDERYCRERSLCIWEISFNEEFFKESYIEKYLLSKKSNESYLASAVVSTAPQYNLSEMERIDREHSKVKKEINNHEYLQSE